MSKLESIKTDLAALDAFIAPNPERAALIARVSALENERDRIDGALRDAVRSLDALDAGDDPAKKSASDFAANMITKYGKSITELRAIVALTS